MKRTQGTLEALLRLYRQMSRRRKLQLVFVSALMFLGALAEIATVGAVLPFLTLVADPSRAASFPALHAIFAQFGWHEPNSIILPAALLFCLIALSAAAIRVLLAWSSNKVVFKIAHDLGVEIYRRALYQPYTYHLTHNSSEIVSVGAKVNVVTSYVLWPLMQAAIAVTIAIFILTALVVIDPFTALSSTLAFGFMYFVVTRITRWRLHANSRTISQGHSQLVKTAQESLGGAIRDVLINNSQLIHLDKFRSIDAALRNAEASNTSISTTPRFVIEGAGVVLIAVMAVLLSRRDGGLLTALPVLGALALGAQRLLPLLQQIYNAVVHLRGNRNTLFDLIEFSNLPISEEHLAGECAKPLSFEHNIVMEQVSFRYAAHLPRVIRNVDIVIAKGTKLGIIGKTGSGKSTLADLIMGLIEPTSGTVRIDGQRLEGRNRLAWQARIAHVPQTIFFSDTTIAENIAFSMPTERIDLERVQRAARMAMISEFIETLPNRYFATVAECGVQLSGGQRQRIAIARALYRCPDILVLDEATSALDSETEEDIMRGIVALGRELTVVVIAHRLSTVRFCDRIVRLESGVVVACQGAGPTSARVKTPSHV